MAIRYNYTFSGTTQLNGKTISSVLDPESQEFLDKLAWVQKVTGLAAPSFEEYFNRNLDETQPGSIRCLNLLFTVPATGAAVRIDAFLLLLNPSVAAHDLNRLLSLGIAPEKIGEYAPPAPPAPVEDWKVPGSPITGPLPGTEEYFSCVNLKLGEIWQAPSGNKYQAGYRGGLGNPGFSATQNFLFGYFCAKRV